jgi:DUF4097 and DUF4098 domain-containing protein YvlB
MTSPPELPRELHHDGARRVRAELGAGLIELSPSADDVTRVSLDVRQDSDEGRYLVANAKLAVVGDEIVVDVPRESSWHTPELLLRVEAPSGLEFRINAGSADITSEVELGDARLVTGSGDIRLTRAAGRLDAKTGSGEIRVEHAATVVTAGTGSGDVEIESAGGPVAASTGSGDVRIGEAGGPTRIKVGSGDITIERVRDHSVATSGSGDVRVEAAHGPSVVAESARGDVSVGVPEGISTYLDLKTVTGDIHCDLEPAEKPADGTPTLALRVRTVSGDITVERV